MMIMSCKGNGVIRMTEKRFECNKGSRITIDNETKLHYIMTLDWECSLVTKLLNRFAEENEQLKSEKKDMQILINTISDQRNEFHRGVRENANRVGKLEKENEQLKQSYTKLEHRHSLLHDECVDAECDRDSYRKDVLSLEKENKQLKQENYDLVKLINDLGNEEMDRQMEEILND